MKYCLFRSTVQIAVLLSALSLPTFAAEQPTHAPQPKVSLKPFTQSATAKTGQTLAGTWKGTFLFDRQDGGKEEVTYIVEIAPDLSTLRVSAAPPLSSNPDAYLNPITKEQAQADWDGDILKAETSQSAQEGKTEIAVAKKFTLRFGKDERHALFTYKTSVKSTTSKADLTNIIRGEGILTRQR